MRSIIEFIPIMFWRCPICHVEETLTVGVEGIFPRKRYIRCADCGATWTEPTETGMTLVTGSAEHLGWKSMDEWEEIASGITKIEGLDASEVPILLNKDEKAIKIGWAELIEEKTFKETRSPFFGGVSVPVGKGIRVHTGKLFRGNDKSITQATVVDEGDFVLTDGRAVFNGRKKTLNMNITKVVGIGVDRGLLMIGYGQRTHTFGFPSESVLKWEYYLRAVGEVINTGRQSVELPTKNSGPSDNINSAGESPSSDEANDSKLLHSNMEELAELIRERNANAAKITKVIGRPAQIGHIGEYIASAIFSVKLEESASRAGHDGHFSEGDLTGKSVNVKMYGKREGLLDINEKNLPDYYLVFTGGKSSTMTSKGQIRPWVVREVFLFNARKLAERLRSHGVKFGVATSVRQEEWEAARIYPSSEGSPLVLTEEQQKLIRLFDV